MAPFRRRERRREPIAALYVHLTDDGAIFVVRGDGSQAWITRRRLHDELAALAAAGGTLLYSRDDPAVDPPAIVFETFKGMIDHRTPVKLLDEPHPDVAEPPPGGATHLMVFAYRGEEDLLEDLLARGAVVEAKDIDGQTALMYAANLRNDGCVRLLLDAGADPNAVDNQRSTPLMFAAQQGDDAIVRRLLAAGADPRPAGDHGMTALDFARQNGHTATADLLARAAPPD